MLKIYLLIVVVLAFGVLVMYNSKVLAVLNTSVLKSEGLFYNVLGKKMKRWSLQLDRASSLKRGSLLSKLNDYFKDIIVNLNMTKDNVTTFGLLTFISTISLSVAILFLVWSGEVFLAIPAFAAIFYFVVVVFRFMSLVRYEKKEADIMDTEDLIAMDIKGGVYNAILRYRNSFHPSMKPYFEEFIDNVQHKGYSFRAAMLLLNDKLGRNFTDFAQKAILYEEKADKDMDDIFSSVIEINRYKRTLRYENNIKFNKLRMEFLISMGVIAIYGIFSVYSDPFLAEFFGDTLLGKFVIIIDIVAITAVLAFIASIKAKFL